MILLFCYLGLFTWNARTGYLDSLAEHSGLELVGYVLSPVVWVKDQCVGYWNSYLALIDVAEENARLREDLRRAHVFANRAAEDLAELDRLRKLLQLDALTEQPGFAARVIAKRFGPHSLRKTFTINKGFLDGAFAGTPVVNHEGVVGRVLRTAPHTSTILMLTDPGFRLAVITQESRTPGILAGSPAGLKRLEVAYVAQNAQLRPGELLITAGVDGIFPKGIPVGVITDVTPGNEKLFLQVDAQPLVDLDRLEEVVLLMQVDSGPPLLERLEDPAPEELLHLPPEEEDDEPQQDAGLAPPTLFSSVSRLPAGLLPDGAGRYGAAS